MKKKNKKMGIYLLLKQLTDSQGEKAELTVKLKGSEAEVIALTAERCAYRAENTALKAELNALRESIDAFNRPAGKGKGNHHG
jgi:hypothetical protein